MFEPIAIIGRACLLPGANSPAELWQNVLQGKNSLTAATPELWRVPPLAMLGQDDKDTTWTDQCGSPSNFSASFDPTGFQLAPEIILSQDSICQWLLQVGRAALLDAGYHCADLTRQKVGAVVGNLSYPTTQLSYYAEAAWLQKQDKSILGATLYQQLKQHKLKPEHRFMSGFPIHFLAEALALTGTVFALDAACASSLYAIKLACDVLQAGKADCMLAGGINATDSLFLQMGFTALQALSQSGQSRPFHRAADGLVPAQGVALVVLKRLQDAIDKKNPILGVIRGIGLANDGRNKGFLVPSGQGQVAAMRQAYQLAGLTPHDVGWVDCHATGTILGDATEIESMQQLFIDSPELTIGALKGNIGHTITASAAAALINTLSIFQHQIKTPTYQAAADPAESILRSPFTLLQKPTEWLTSKGKKRLAAINAFGFGGNNAHLLVEEWCPKKKIMIKPSTQTKEKIALVGIGMVVASAKNSDEFAAALFKGQSLLQPYDQASQGGYLAEVALNIRQVRFPPGELQCALGQQLAILAASAEALDKQQLDSQRVSVIIGMQCDATVALPGLRWRLPHLLMKEEKAWLAAAKATVFPPLQSGHVLGMMPNLVANRLNQVFNFTAPSFTVSSEELSGITALQLGIQALQNNEIDAAIVGAVDMNCEVVHQTAMHQLYGANVPPPSDAAVVFVLKRLTDAKQQQDKIYALLSDTPLAEPQLKITAPHSEVTQLMGHAHAASGLLHVAAAALACHHRLLLSGIEKNLTAWLTTQPRTAAVKVQALGKQTATLYLQEEESFHPSSLAKKFPTIFLYQAPDKATLLENLKRNIKGNDGPCRLAIVAREPEEFTRLQKIALTQLMENSALSSGIYFRERPLLGKLAFVFTGAATSYPGMGQDLWLKSPALLTRFMQEKVTAPTFLANLQALNARQTMNHLSELATCAFLSQFHAYLSQQHLNIQPNAVIGYCAGETNALFALGAWQDEEKLFADLAAEQIYSHKLAGEFAVLNKKIIAPWVMWRVQTDVTEVARLIKQQTDVHLTIINSPNDCVIAGAAPACARLLQSLPQKNAKQLDYSMVIHCPEFNVLAQTWYKLHHRPTQPISDIDFYSTATGRPYPLSAENVAQALLQQAADCVDFPRVIKNAWQDGVRIFLEHGPRNLCSRWINTILTEQEHLAVALDSTQHDALWQMASTVAQLQVAGVKLNAALCQEN